MNHSFKSALISIPDGASATYEDMRNSGKAIQSFICQAEAMLPSIKDDKKHNEIVDYLHQLGEGYNRELRKLNHAQQQRRQVAFIIRCGLNCEE